MSRHRKTGNDIIASKMIGAGLMAGGLLLAPIGAAVVAAPVASAAPGTPGDSGGGGGTGGTNNPPPGGGTGGIDGGGTNTPKHPKLHNAIKKAVEHRQEIVQHRKIVIHNLLKPCK